MITSPHARVFAALTLTIARALCGTTAAADTPTESGAPLAFESGRSAPAPVPPAGLDDLLRPIAEPGQRSTALTPPACDAAIFEATAPEHAPCWEFLAGIAPEDRDAASIEIEPVTRDGARNAAAGRDIEALWNTGRPAEAIDTLQRLEGAARASWTSTTTPTPDTSSA